MAGVRSSEFWDLTPAEYNLIVDGYQERLKENLYRDLRNAYYTGCFAQVEKPKELYDRILESIDSKPQTAEEIFNFLKSMANRSGVPQEDVLDSHFSIPLKLTPEFDAGVFSYIHHLEGDSVDLYLPDVALSINGNVLKSDNGLYTIGPGLMKIKYGEQVYTIIMIRADI